VEDRPTSYDRLARYVAANIIFARVRLYIDGRLVDDVTVAAGRNAEDDAIPVIAALHGRRCQAAEAAGSTYMVEFIFDDGEHVRFGTDVDGMVVPAEVGLDRLAKAVVERLG
jgi:hypothetical protein